MRDETKRTLRRHVGDRIAASTRRSVTRARTPATRSTPSTPSPDSRWGCPNPLR